MAELESKKTVKSTRGARKKLADKVSRAFDTTPEDVLKWVEEGRKIYFGDEDDFLELSDDVVAKLPADAKQRYSVAKMITMGEDPIAVAEQAAFDVKFDYNKRLLPTKSQLTVTGKDPSKEYHWVRTENVDKRKLDGWVVDQDKNAKTVVDEGAIKYVGGQSKPEMVLMSVGKQHLGEIKKKKREVKERILKSQKDIFRETIERSGSKAIVD